MEAGLFAEVQHQEQTTLLRKRYLMDVMMEDNQKGEWIIAAKDNESIGGPSL